MYVQHILREVSVVIMAILVLYRTYYPRYGRTQPVVVRTPLRQREFYVRQQLIMAARVGQ